MNTRMPYRLGVLAGAVFALAILAGFTSCGGDSGGSINGTWASQYGEVLTVTGDDFSYSMNGYPAYDYAGKIEAGDPRTGKSGYLTVKITSAGSANVFKTGTYIRIFWKDLTATTVSEAGPYKVGGDNSGAASAGAAATKFTVENGYFDGTGVYEKK